MANVELDDVIVEKMENNLTFFEGENPDFENLSHLKLATGDMHDMLRIFLTQTVGVWT